MTVMTDPAAFERDPYLRELDTEVVRAGAEGGRAWAVLSDTVCFPEGGGQPADRGWLGDVPVVDVQWTEGEIRHLVAAPLAPGPVRVRLDWERRFDHMQQHTGQHLLTAIAQDRFAWPTTAFHLGAEICDVELDVPALSPERLAALEEAVNAAIRSALPVAARRVDERAYAGLAVRTRGLPAGHHGDVRLVEIAGVDRNTCSGTHVRSTAEIGCLKLLGGESLRGGTRVAFVAGDRVLRRLGVHETRNAALRSLLGAPDAGLVDVAAAKLEELRALERRARAAEDELADALAATLAGSAGALVEAHRDGGDLAFLQRAGRRLVALAPAKAALLTATGAGGSCFVVVAGAQCGLDAQAAGRLVAAALGGRGGGSGQLAQGKTASLAGRDEALRLLRDAAPGA